ncbi:major facilitator superfamily domain-containing protein [Lipomyces tetrasporus]
MSSKEVSEKVTADERNLPSVKPLAENRRWWKFFDEYEYRDLYERNGRQHKWYHWFDENDTAEDRRYILKLDVFITSYCLISYWVKNLDQTNVNNAYVSGMKEELNLQGNALVDMQVMYSVGAVVFQLPFLYLFPKCRMNWLIPGMDIIWGFFTLAQYRATSKAQMMAYRFLIGCAEAPFFPGVHYVLGAWFKSHEIQRRGGIFYMGLMLGSTTAGLLQSSIHKHLNGVNGLSGWRWMFIVDAVITIPVGIIGFVMWPGTPDKLHSFFFTEKDAEIARRRAKRNGTGAPKGFRKDVLKRVFTSWHLPVLSFWNVLFWNSSAQSQGVFLLWLKSLGRFDTVKLNNLGSIPPALGVVYIFITCFGADVFRSRWFFLCLAQGINWINLVILAIWNVPESAKWFAFMVQYFSISMSSVLYGWTNDILRHDDEYRSVVLILMTAIAQQSTAWLPLIFWQTVDQPRYLKGYSFAGTVAFTLICWTFFVLYYFKREEKEYYFKRLHESEQLESETESASQYSSRKGDNAVESDSEVMR